MPRVIDIQRRHMELGRIRLGEKGAKGQPQRLDTWRLTSASKALLDSAAAAYGGTVEEWTDAPDKGYYQLTTDTTELDVMVPPGDAYSQYYELWSGGGCKRRCDGVTELLTGSPCKCDADERECKITTRINVMLPRVAGLGVWRLESHGYYAAAELPDMLELLQQVSGGRLVSGVLRIEQRSSKKDGRTNRFPVPVLDLPNITLASLTGGQVVVNPPRQLEPGKPALANGDTLLPGDPAFDNGSPEFGERPALPMLNRPEEADGDLRDRIVETARRLHLDLGAIERAADAVGVPKGATATTEQLRAIVAHLEQPADATAGAGAAVTARGGEDARATPPPSDTPSPEELPDSSGSAMATDSAAASPPAVESGIDSDEVMQQVLDITGGEEVTPKGRTTEEAIAAAQKRATKTKAPV